MHSTCQLTFRGRIALSQMWDSGEDALACPVLSGINNLFFVYSDPPPGAELFGDQQSEGSLVCIREQCSGSCGNQGAKVSEEDQTAALGRDVITSAECLHSRASVDLVDSRSTLDGTTITCRRVRLREDHRGFKVAAAAKTFTIDDFTSDQVIGGICTFLCPITDGPTVANTSLRAATALGEDGLTSPRSHRGCSGVSTSVNDALLVEDGAPTNGTFLYPTTDGPTVENTSLHATTLLGDDALTSPRPYRGCSSASTPVNGAPLMDDGAKTYGIPRHSDPVGAQITPRHLVVLAGERDFDILNAWADAAVNKLVETGVLNGRRFTGHGLLRRMCLLGGWRRA